MSFLQLLERKQQVDAAMFVDCLIDKQIYIFFICLKV